MSGPGVFGTNPYAANRPIKGTIVTVLRGVTERRGLQLEEYRSRAVAAGQIHELMLTDEAVEPGMRVDRVSLIGFFEVTTAGVLLVGATVKVGDKVLGTLAGFDETHMPNHQNICIQAERLIDGEALGVAVEDTVTFERE